MRDKNQKLLLAQKNNTRVVYSNNPESQIMLDLASDVDKLYKYIRKNAGVNIPIEKAELLRKQYIHIAMSIEGFLMNTSKELNLKNLRGSFFLNQIIKQNKESNDVG